MPERLIPGIYYGILENLTWIRAYLILIATGFLLYYRIFAATPEQVDWVFIGAPIVITLFGVGIGKYIDQRQLSKSLGKQFAVACVAFSLTCSTLELLRLTTPETSAFILVSLVVAAFAWTVALVIIFLIILFPGLAFNPDFADLKQAIGYYKRIWRLPGILLLLIAAQQLVLWPSLVTEHTPGFDLFHQIAESSEIPKPVPNWALEITSLLIALIILNRAIRGFYIQLAHRLWREPSKEQGKSAADLIRSNLKYRVQKEGTPVWPRSTKESPIGANSAELRVLEDFILDSTFAAVTFTFGFWVPVATTSLQNANLIPLLILVMFLAGSVDIWLHAIEVTGVKGARFALGLWISTIFLYWPTTVLSVFAITATQRFIVVFNVETGPNIQSIFIVIYQVTLAGLTLFMALNQLTPNSREKGTTVVRFALATVALLLLVGLPTQSYIAGSGDQNTAILLAALFLIMTGTILFILTHRFWWTTEVPQGVAQIVASGSLALAPLLAGSRVSLDRSGRTETQYVDLSITNRLSDNPMKLRLHVVGSEDEVAFQATDRSRINQFGVMDFIITDLQTALCIMAHFNEKDNGSAYNYAILTFVGIIPWRRVDITRRRNTRRDTRMFLEGGFLPYSTPLEPSVPFDHPRRLYPDQYRVTDFATIAKYAIKHSWDIDGVLIPEPYFSRVVRHKGEVIRARGAQQYDTVYVVLVRQHKEIKLEKPSVFYNWRYVLAEQIADGRLAAHANRGVIDHEQLHKLHQVLGKLTQGKIDLNLDDLQLGLIGSNFSTEYPASLSSYYKLVLADLSRNKLVDLNVIDEALNNPPAASIDLGALLRVLQTSKLNLIERDLFTFFHKPVPTLPLEFEEYLVHLAIFPVIDRPSHLSALLAEVKEDLALLASANIGASVLVYLLNTKSIPSVETSALMKPLGNGLRGSELEGWVAWLDSMRQHHFENTHVGAFMFAISHSEGSLRSLINEFLMIKPNGVNIEQAFTFPVTKDRAIALLITKPSDHMRVLSHFLTPPTTETISTSRPPKLYASEVQLEPSFTFEPHKQTVIFRNIDRRHFFSEIKFDSSVRTQTITWGDIDHWREERRASSSPDTAADTFEIWLKVPTEIAWRLVVFGWMAKIPFLGEWIAKFVTGAAGTQKYQDRNTWTVEIE